MKEDTESPSFTAHGNVVRSYEKHWYSPQPVRNRAVSMSLRKKFPRDKVQRTFRIADNVGKPQVPNKSSASVQSILKTCTRLNHYSTFAVVFASLNSVSSMITGVFA